VLQFALFVPAAAVAALAAIPQTEFVDALLGLGVVVVYAGTNVPGEPVSNNPSAVELALAEEMSRTQTSGRINVDVFPNVICACVCPANRPTTAGAVAITAARASRLRVLPAIPCKCIVPPI
jgi:hypothetical protein